MEKKDKIVSSSVYSSSSKNFDDFVPKSDRVERRGRPKKADIEAKKKRAVIGRPPGEAARIREFHARLLTTKGDHIIETIIKKALDPTDKDQAAMLKMCADRLLPLSYFEKDKANGNKGITINISGVTDIKPVIDQEAEDVTYYEEEK